ncbi:MAG: transglycosylase SLT domain-containing protein [Candidatus Woesearchaeota archaeon]|nr:transglycosylase SLT domain-containing protein [Candidatus Woesearchaeota archaeon]
MDRRDFLSHACRIVGTTAFGLSMIETVLVSDAEAALKKQLHQPKPPAPKPAPRFHIPESPPVFITADYHPPTSSEYRQRIERATLDFLHDRYADKPFWGSRKVNDVDIEKRIHWILHWTMKGVQEAAPIFPVDPLVLIAQMYEESRFNEFAISSAAAAGVAQFIKPSAKEYGMQCAGKQNREGCKLPEHADAYERFLKIGAARARAQRVIMDIEDVPENYLDLKEMSEQQQSALNNYRRFLAANVKGRDIFDEKDRRFLEGFDERFGYRKPIPAMAVYMAGNLKECNGYVAAALIGYNAGMGWVREKKGRMPMIKESVRYAEAIQFTYRAIAQRANV